MIKKKCAFHHQYDVTHFCKCIECLLPLCVCCIPIHKYEHTSIPEPIHISSLQSVVKEVSLGIEEQLYKLNHIQKQIVKQYNQSQQEHYRIWEQVIRHRDMLIQTINQSYESLFVEMKNSERKRKQWIQKTNQSTIDLKKEFQVILQSLNEDKCLRSVIMWNKLKPYQLIDNINESAQKHWLKPLFQKISRDCMVRYITQNTKLHLLQIQGQPGLEKLMKCLKILQFGHQAPIPPQNTTNLKTIETQSGHKPQINEPKKLSVTGSLKKFDNENQQIYHFFGKNNNI